MKSITFDKVSFGYNSNSNIFNDLSFTFKCPDHRKGFVIAVMGASGTGKTTLLKLILRLLTPNSGNIITNPSSPVISYVPQEGVLFDHLSPLQNARYFSQINKYKNFFDDSSYHSLSEILGLKDILKYSKDINELSGGERQRITLLRALLVKPSFILLDEPTTGIGSDVKLQFLSQLRESISSQNIMALYVTHHKIEAEFIADEIAYLNKDVGSGIDRIYQDDVFSFTSAPPIIDAVKVFNYPTPNVIECNIDNTGNIILSTKENGNNDYFIAVSPLTISINENNGFSFRIISSNPIYSFIELENSQILTIYTPKDRIEYDSKISISGKVLQYSRDYQFVSFLYLENNKIILTT